MTGTATDMRGEMTGHSAPSTDTGDAGVQRHPALVALTIGAIGVVFGDIGTSPLYAFREALAQ